ncbi:MAG TPA: uroporphyrinogen-III synthase [Terriglobales bacterium]|nr:uroporphyrinogen-III synthase [Terriglobales bacterium]
MDKTHSEGFGGLRVLAFESRRAREMRELITKNGGQPLIVPSTREVPARSNQEALDFVAGLGGGRFDTVIFLTGVGTRLLAREIETVCPRDQFVSALSRTAVVARGPKPVAALRELGVPIALTVPEPNTWREILKTLDENQDRVPIKGRRVAVQEYGVTNPELLAGLSERGADVVPVRVYEWALPEDTGPLESAVDALISGEVDVAMFTASVQLLHLLEIAERLQRRSDVIAALNQIVVASIGPVTSNELRRQGIAVDFEPTHPKMGFLVKEAAERSPSLLQGKRSMSPRSAV